MTHEVELGTKMGILTKRVHKMATAPKLPKRRSLQPPTDAASEVEDFASKVEDFIESRRAKMTGAQRAEADAKATALFAEHRTER